MLSGEVIFLEILYVEQKDSPYQSMLHRIQSSAIFLRAIEEAEEDFMNSSLTDRFGIYFKRQTKLVSF